MTAAVSTTQSTATTRRIHSSTAPPSGARHWRAWGIALCSLLVVGWAAYLQPQTSPKGYIPIFLGIAVLAVGYVYLDEETQFHFAST